MTVHWIEGKRHDLKNAETEIVEAVTDLAGRPCLTAERRPQRSSGLMSSSSRWAVSG